MSLQEPQWDNLAAESWSELDATMAARAAMHHVPLGGTFEVTPFCNLHCKMCYVRLDKPQADAIGRELILDEWISLADQALDAGTLNLLVTGGEPMLRPDFIELYTALAQRPFILSINTNATLMTPEIKALFMKMPPSSVAVTMYGASPETYGKICGRPEAFEQTIRGLEMLAEVPTHLEIRTTFIKDNMHDLFALRDIARRYTNSFSINYTVFAPIRGATADVAGCRMSAEEAMELDATYRRSFESEDISDSGDVMANATDIEAVEDAEPNLPYLGHDLPPTILECLAAKAMFWITWDGKMLPCGTFSSPYTLPLKEGFLPAWNRLPGLFTDIRLPAACEGCEYNELGCPNCPANTQAETGRFDTVAPYLCDMAKARYHHWQLRHEKK